MKVLKVMTTEFGKTGITNVVLNLYNAMDKHGVQIDFVFLNNPPQTFFKQVEENGGEIFVLDKRLANPIKYYLKLKKIMKNEKYDVVHVHGNSHTMAIELRAAQKSSIPVRISHGHSTSTSFPSVHKILTKQFHKSYTHALACGNLAGKWLYDGKEFEVLNNGIDVGKYAFNLEKRDSLRESLGVSQKNRVIIQIGSFTENKNHNYTLGVLHELLKIDENYRLVFVGDGPTISIIKKNVEERKLSLQVKFLGLRDDIPELLSMSDLLILPSKFEGMPLTVIEAQAADLYSFVSRNVTSAIKIVNNVSFFSLEDEPYLNAVKIQEKQQLPKYRARQLSNKTLEQSDFNIVKVAKRLRGIYFNE